jgi:hypothetical protein
MSQAVADVLGTAVGNRRDPRLALQIGDLGRCSIDPTDQPASESLLMRYPLFRPLLKMPILDILKKIIYLELVLYGSGAAFKRLVRTVARYLVAERGGALFSRKSGDS